MKRVDISTSPLIHEYVTDTWHLFKRLNRENYISYV